MKNWFKKSTFIASCALMSSTCVWAQRPPADLLLDDPEDIRLLDEDFSENRITEDSFVDSGDDLDGLKDDLGDIEFSLPKDDKLIKSVEKIERIDQGKKPVILKGDVNSKEASIIFDVGKEEKDLLEVAKLMEGKIPNQEWNEIAAKSNTGTYEVVRGDWLWKISQNLFGSGFYYAKIWSLNPYITNPHQIEPGMILVFSTGSDKSLPSLSIEQKDTNKQYNTAAKSFSEYDKWGDDVKPDWLLERERLKSEGVFIQYSSTETKDDLDRIGDQALNKEYESYEPPRIDFAIDVPEDEFDSVGFDKNAKISFSYKEGFDTNTFISSNIVQDFGRVDSSFSEQNLFTTHDTFYVRFDEKIDVVAGDKFSTYTAEGKVSHKNSDRDGYKYTISGSFETVRKHEGLWECRVTHSSGTISRGDRVTVYTPKIERITKTYNNRLIESVVIASFHKLQRFPSFGDLVYLDRGRADGVETGNVFEVYGFKDRATKKNITDNPTYKNGELTVLTVTDNFSTALVTSSVRDFSIGDIAVTKTKAQAARATRLKQGLLGKDSKRLSEKALDELDVELNLDDLNDSLLDKADQIQFTEDELAELERQEREKSIISENEKDLKSLERLESEIETAEKMLNEARLDEDKLLENQSLDKMERDFGHAEQDSLDEIEENFGKRYLDEDINDKENPYGLTEFDIEEIDELLNVEKELEE